MVRKNYSPPHNIITRRKRSPPLKRRHPRCCLLWGTLFRALGYRGNDKDTAGNPQILTRTHRISLEKPLVAIRSMGSMLVNRSYFRCVSNRAPTKTSSFSFWLPFRTTPKLPPAPQLPELPSKRQTAHHAVLHPKRRCLVHGLAHPGDAAATRQLLETHLCHGMCACVRENPPVHLEKPFKELETQANIYLSLLLPSQIWILMNLK